VENFLNDTKIRCFKGSIVIWAVKFPIYIPFGDTQILLHTILEPLAFFIGFRYFLFLKHRRGDVIGEGNRIWILIAAVFGALLGSRIVGAMENPIAMLKADNLALYFYSNKTVLGGFLGGLWSVELVKKIIGEKKSSGDLFVYPIILALIIGRLGCFSMGLEEETYGSATGWVTGMDLGDGIPRHPVTLYEIGFLVLVWFGLHYLSVRSRLANGSVFKLFMISYILFRFFLDFIKPHYTYSFGLSTIQVVCLAGLLWYTQYIISPKRLLQPLNTYHA
jgi:prolipoprotein diacylglyceryltransferase